MQLASVSGDLLAALTSAPAATPSANGDGETAEGFAAVLSAASGEADAEAEIDMSAPPPPALREQDFSLLFFSAPVASWPALNIPLPEPESRSAAGESRISGAGIATEVHHPIPHHDPAPAHHVAAMPDAADLPAIQPPQSQEMPVFAEALGQTSRSEEGAEFVGTVDSEASPVKRESASVRLTQPEAAGTEAPRPEDMPLTSSGISLADSIREDRNVRGSEAPRMETPPIGQEPRADIGNPAPTPAPALNPASTPTSAPQDVPAQQAMPAVDSVGEARKTHTAARPDPDFFATRAASDTTVPRVSGEIAFSGRVKEAAEPSPVPVAAAPVAADRIAPPTQPDAQQDLEYTDSEEPKVTGPRTPASTSGHVASPYHAFTSSDTTPTTRAESGASTVAPPRPVAAEPELPGTVQPRPLETMRFTAGTDAGERAEIQLSHRNGAIEMTVRTPHSELAQSLRTGLPELASALESKGFQPEIRAGGGNLSIADATPVALSGGPEVNLAERSQSEGQQDDRDSQRRHAEQWNDEERERRPRKRYDERNEDD